MCGKERIYKQTIDSEYRLIKILVGKRWSTASTSVSTFASEKLILVCADCQDFLGINHDTFAFDKEPELLEKILAIFKEVFDEVKDEF